MNPSTASVPAAVLTAFGLPEHGYVIPGGEGRSFRHGNAVLKPVDDPTEAEWTAQLLSTVAPRGFRQPAPIRSADGRWVVGGWAASAYVTGGTGPAGRWEELLAVSRAFHNSLAHVPRPGFLDHRTHRWARADRAAWGEQRIVIPADASGLWGRLRRLVRPVNGRSQLIHGDLSGNVLFADGGVPPAVIDFSPYWRPAGYADAIIAIDGVLWFGADRQLLTEARDGPGFAQLLVRALMFRLGALTEKANDVDPACLSELALFAPVVDLVEHQVAEDSPRN